jgi:hypothetical protein
MSTVGMVKISLLVKLGKIFRAPHSLSINGWWVARQKYVKECYLKPMEFIFNIQLTMSTVGMVKLS